MRARDPLLPFAVLSSSTWAATKESWFLAFPLFRTAFRLARCSPTTSVSWDWTCSRPAGTQPSQQQVEAHVEDAEQAKCAAEKFAEDAERAMRAAEKRAEDAEQKSFDLELAGKRQKYNMPTSTRNSLTDPRVRDTVEVRDAST